MSTEWHLHRCFESAAHVVKVLLDCSHSAQAIGNAAPLLTCEATDVEEQHVESEPAGGTYGGRE